MKFPFMPISFLLTGDEAAKAIHQDFQQAAKQLLFRQVGESVFMQVIRMGEEKYRLYLIDPGWINPSDSDVAIQIQEEGNFEVENALSGEDYPVNDHVFQVHIPAGLF